MLQSVSIPFRGKGIGKVRDRLAEEEYQMFPSPFGAKVSESGGKKQETVTMIMFPSPFGAKVSERVHFWKPYTEGI